MSRAARYAPRSLRRPSTRRTTRRRSALRFWATWVGICVVVFFVSFFWGKDVFAPRMLRGATTGGHLEGQPPKVLVDNRPAAEGAAHVPANAPTSPSAYSQSPQPGKSRFAVQAGSFVRRAAAQARADQLSKQGHQARIVPVTVGNATEYAVEVGDFDNEEEARALRDRLADAGWESQVVERR